MRGSMKSTAAVVIRAKGKGDKMDEIPEIKLGSVLFSIVEPGSGPGLDDREQHAAELDFRNFVHGFLPYPSPG